MFLVNFHRILLTTTVNIINFRLVMGGLQKEEPNWHKSPSFLHDHINDYLFEKKLQAIYLMLYKRCSADHGALPHVSAGDIIQQKYSINSSSSSK